MSNETNKATMLRLWQVLDDEVWPTGNLAVNFDSAESTLDVG